MSTTAKILSYFTLSDDGAKCMVENCITKLASLKPYNLKRHIRVAHKHIAIENGWLTPSGSNITEPRTPRIDENNWCAVRNLFIIGDDSAICTIDNCSRKLSSTQHYNLKRHISLAHKEVFKSLESNGLISSSKSDAYKSPEEQRTKMETSTENLASPPLKTALIGKYAYMRARYAELSNYFVSKDGYLFCNIDLCDNKLPVGSYFYHKQHIMQCHKAIALRHGWMKDESEKPMKIPKLSSVEPTYNTNFSQTISQFKENIIKNLVTLVTVDELPISFLECESLKNLLEPTFSSSNIKYSEFSLLKQVEATVAHIKNVIKNEINNRLVCLKIDSVIQQDKIALGIHIQYLNEDEIIIRTLSIIEINDFHTEDNIINEIFAILCNFDIKLTQIYSCIIDKGGYDYNNEATTSAYKGSVMDLINLTIKLYNGNESPFNSLTFLGYSLHLAVQDALHEDSFSKILLSIRFLAEKLSELDLQEDCYEIYFTAPKIDPEIRWNTLYYMLDTIIDQEVSIAVILQRKNEILLKEFQNLIGCMKIVHQMLEIISKTIATLENENLIIGDLYKFWLETELQLRYLDVGQYTELRDALTNNLNIRKQNLFDQEIVLSALYLDPRFNYFGSKILTEDNKVAAKMHLKKLYDYLQSTSENKVDDKNVSETQNSEKIDLESSSTSSLNNLSLLELEFREEEKLLSNDNKAIPIDFKLDQLCFRERAGCDENIINYWKQLKKDKTLYQLAEIILAVPASQATLKCVTAAVNDQNSYEISKNDVLLIKLNKSLMDNIDCRIYKNGFEPKY